MAEEDRLVLTSVGVDIGSSTSHLLFSRLELERQDGRYVTVKRDVLYQSDILLTPYVGATTIDGASLGAFIDRQYVAAGLARDQVDTGALILTGVALLRDNARAIADLFAGERVKGLVIAKGAQDVIPIRPGRLLVIAVEPARVRITHGIKPVHRLHFGVAR